MRMRLGMYFRSLSDKCDFCGRQLPSKDYTWHPLHCVLLSGASITDRHNAVLHTIAHFARLMLLSPRVEPAQLCRDSAKRPDIQLDLPLRTLLGDITVIHPLSPSNYGNINSRVVERIGDKAAGSKDDKYKELEDQLDVRFFPLVFYSYGGIHRSALTFIKVMAKALDEQACLLSRSEWRTQLLQHIAIALQRGNADIMLRHEQRERARGDFRVISGRKRRLDPPLYSVSDVPWMGDGGNDGEGPPDSLPPSIFASLSPSSPESQSQYSEGAPPSIVFDSSPSLASASLSPSSSVVSPAPNREGSDGDELMQVVGVSDAIVQRGDSGVSGSYVSVSSATPAVSYIPATGGGGGGVVIAAMEEEVMEWGRGCGRDVVFDPHTISWIGGGGSGSGMVSTARQGVSAEGAVLERPEPCDADDRKMGGDAGAVISGSVELGRLGVDAGGHVSAEAEVRTNRSTDNTAIVEAVVHVSGLGLSERGEDKFYAQ